MAVLSAPHQSDILDKKIISKRGACDSEPLTTQFTSIENVANLVKNAISDPTITSIISGAKSALELFKGVMSMAECNSRKDSTVTMLQGLKEDIVLKPGEQLVFSIISGSILGGHINNKGRATARIVSEGYVAGVLFSEKGGSKGCCDEEKIGSYALSSLSEFEHEKIPPIFKPHKSTLNPLDKDIFNQSGPIGGFGSVAATVSSFLGVNGPWGGVFDPTGCCDDVAVECYSECGTYRNCPHLTINFTPYRRERKN